MLNEFNYGCIFIHFFEISQTNVKGCVKRFKKKEAMILR